MDLQSIKNRFGIIGNDPQLNYSLQVSEQVANTDLSVLIIGESGVGKEVFSQIIHNLSARRHNPFIAVNCGAIPEGTIDSELFGHEKGAFTSAGEQRKGYFETVNGGTIFLDEIGEMPLGTQARLLRVLETGEYIRVGSSKVLKTDVRVVAATNKDLLKLTKEGKFREDLYYRLNTVPIRVPSLRERKEDIPLLFRKFASDFAEKYKTEPVHLDEESKKILMNYGWPGNVRELKNIAEQISVLVPDKNVNATVLNRFLPKNTNDLPLALPYTGQNAPLYTPQSSEQKSAESNTEREILYKLFFDLKKDMNELKQMMFEFTKIKTGDNNFIPTNALAPAPIMNGGNSYGNESNNNRFYPTEDFNSFTQNAKPYIIEPTNAEHDNNLTNHEDIDESLSLADREKEFIIKSLQKHKGRRKDAAKELGISERTLYRKIKEYDIEE